MRHPESKGILLLSFDDRNFAGWESALPLFARTNAHATFFVCGQWDEEAVSAMRRLSAAGHSVGLHGLAHANADKMIAETSPEEYYRQEVLPQVEAARRAGIPFTSFAYPNCRRTEEADQLLFSHGFSFVRGGLGLTPFDPEGRRVAEWKPLVSIPRTAFPVAELPSHRLLNTLLVGEAYNTQIDDLLNCIRRIAERNEVLVITSHDIAPDAHFINMKLAWLEAMLTTAAELGVAVLGYDELPKP